MRPTEDMPGILVVDDDRLLREMIGRALKSDGFAVWSAANGNEAISLYREHIGQIDAVLLDVCMIGLDGPQTLDALRQVNSKVAACFMSGSLGTYRREDLTTANGAARVFDKPFHLDDLLAALRLLTTEKTAQ